ncbi:ATP-binding cassette domain-containing protein [Aureimonas altamirensis]|uniref:thiamine ABC transporter ATP-binding protein n=1 Tax=Aureimonas altamirensis TaxID=370622 RepID=UPI0030177F23
MTAQTALVLDDVTFAHEGLTLQFDLHVAAGEWLAIIGPSGAGKSTLLDIVAGFLQPDRGRVLFNGSDMTSAAPSDRPVSFVFQENNLFPNLTAEANVLLGLTTALRASPAEKQLALAALDAVGLSGFGKRLPAAMSGGERQRVALARAMVRKRPLLLLDEPLAALGPAMRQDILALMARLRREAGLTILMVTHQPDDAIGYADRIAYVENGRIAAIGTTAEMLGPPPNPALAAYLTG